VGIFGARVAVIYAEVEGFALVESCIGGSDVSGRGDVIDFDLGGLVGGAAVFVGDGEGDLVVTVVGVGVGDVLSGDGVGAVAEVPGVGEVVAGAAVFGEGG
jgi:hypothetical protein